MHLVSQIEDIDARKKSEAAIAEAETRWSFALASAGQGWDFDVKRGSSYYSPVWKQMLGYGEDELDTDPGLWLSLVHPDDAMPSAPPTGAYRRQYAVLRSRIPHAHAGHWVRGVDRGKVLERDAEGNAIRAIERTSPASSRRKRRLIACAHSLPTRRSACASP